MFWYSPFSVKTPQCVKLKKSLVNRIDSCLPCWKKTSERHNTSGKIRFPRLRFTIDRNRHHSSTSLRQKQQQQESKSSIDLRKNANNDNGAAISRRDERQGTNDPQTSWFSVENGTPRRGFVGCPTHTWWWFFR